MGARRLRLERQMSDTDSIDIAQRRLALALDALDAATERRRDADRAETALANQVHALDSDRARLFLVTDRDVLRRLDLLKEEYGNER